MDAVEMDIAKLFQSLICNYSSWSECMELVSYHNDKYTISSDYLKDSYERIQHLFTKEKYKKGLFYMSTYFIRMVPFMLHKSLQHAIFILLLSIHYLEYITKS